LRNKAFVIHIKEEIFSIQDLIKEEVWQKASFEIKKT